jgi:hypothetical protein
MTMRLHNPVVTKKTAVLGLVGIAVVLVAVVGILIHITHRPAAMVEDVRPAESGLAGGAVVTISGSNFGPGTEVRFGSVAARTVRIVNSTSIIATTAPTTELGEADVTVIRHGRSNTLVGSFRYEAPLHIASALPASGPAAGGQEVTLHGSGFAKDSYIDFGGAHVAKLTYVSQNLVKVVTGPRAPGSVDINIMNNDDTAFLPEAYTYQ